MSQGQESRVEQIPYSNEELIQRENELWTSIKSWGILPEGGNRWMWTIRYTPNPLFNEHIPSLFYMAFWLGRWLHIKSMGEEIHALHALALQDMHEEAYVWPLVSTHNFTSLINRAVFCIKDQQQHANDAHERQNGYQPWQAFWIVHQLGCLTIARLTSSNVSPALLEHYETFTASASIHASYLFNQLHLLDQGIPRILHPDTPTETPIAFLTRLTHIIQMKGAWRDANLHTLLLNALNLDIFFLSPTASGVHTSAFVHTSRNKRLLLQEALKVLIQASRDIESFLYLSVPDPFQADYKRRGRYVLGAGIDAIQIEFNAHEARVLALMHATHRNNMGYSALHLLDENLLKQIAKLDVSFP